MWKKIKKTTKCEKRIVTCDTGTKYCQDGTIKCDKKNKGTTECDKRSVTYNVKTT